jgi:hypothetical protein
MSEAETTQTSEALRHEVSDAERIVMSDPEECKPCLAVSCCIKCPYIAKRLEAQGRLTKHMRRLIFDS